MPPKKFTKTDKSRALKKVIDREIDKKLRSEVERKFLDTAAYSLDMSGAGGTQDLMVISQGLLDNNRIGDVVKVTDIEMRGYVEINANGTATNSRLVLYQWFDVVDGTSGAPWYPDILNSNYSTTANACNSPFNQDTRDQFRVLYDRTFTTDTEHRQVQFAVNLQNLKLRKTHYIAGSAAYASGKIYMLVVSNDQTAISTGMPQLTYVSKVQYRDA